MQPVLEITQDWTDRLLKIDDTGSVHTVIDTEQLRIEMFQTRVQRFLGDMMRKET